MNFNLLREKKAVNVGSMQNIELNALSLWRRSGHPFSPGCHFFHFCAQRWCESMAITDVEQIQVVGAQPGASKSGFNVLNVFLPPTSTLLDTHDKIRDGCASFSMQPIFIAGRSFSMESVKVFNPPLRGRNLPVNIQSYKKDCLVLILQDGEPFNTNDRLLVEHVNMTSFQNYFRNKVISGVSIEGGVGHKQPSIIVKFRDEFNDDGALLQFILDISMREGSIATLPSFVGRRFSIEPVVMAGKRQRQEEDSS